MQISYCLKFNVSNLSARWHHLSIPRCGSRLSWKERVLRVVSLTLFLWHLPAVPAPLRVVKAKLNSEQLFTYFWLCKSVPSENNTKIQSRHSSLSARFLQICPLSVRIVWTSRNVPGKQATYSTKLKGVLRVAGSQCWIETRTVSKYR